MLKHMIRSRLVVATAAIGILSFVLMMGVGVGSWVVRASANPYPEADSIGKNVSSFQKLSDRFTSLAQAKGGVYAFDVLKIASLPPNTDLHLLGHVVGDILYKQKGVAGMLDCTQDFRNACSHAIVIGTLNEFGPSKGLSLIHDACAKAPGGSGAYTMCYHYANKWERRSITIKNTRNASAGRLWNLLAEAATITICGLGPSKNISIPITLFRRA
jgi:hypothetical protein